MEIRKNIDFLIGKILLQICFGLYQVQLNFNDGVSIEIGGEIIYKAFNKQQYIWKYSNGRILFPINNLIEFTINKAVFSDDKSLILEFSNGECLTINSTGDNNESYIVKSGNDFEVIY